MAAVALRPPGASDSTSNLSIDIPRSGNLRHHSVTLVNPFSESETRDVRLAVLFFFTIGASTIAITGALSNDRSVTIGSAVCSVIVELCGLLISCAK